MARRVILEDCEFAVVNHAGGAAVLVIREPNTGDRYEIEFKPQAKGRLSAQLSGVVLPTSELPPLAANGMR